LYQNDAADRMRTQNTALHLEPATSGVTRRNNCSGADLTCAVLSDAHAG
jgi:hypothetical protein